MNLEKIKQKHDFCKSVIKIFTRLAKKFFLMYYRFYNTQKEKKEYASVIRKRTKHKRQNLQTGFQYTVRSRITGVLPTNKI